MSVNSYNRTQDISVLHSTGVLVGNWNEQNALNQLINQKIDANNDTFIRTMHHTIDYNNNNNNTSMSSTQSCYTKPVITHDNSDVKYYNARSNWNVDNTQHVTNNSKTRSNHSVISFNCINDSSKHDYTTTYQSQTKTQQRTLPIKQHYHVTEKITKAY